MARPAGRVVLHNVARRAILDALALAPADRLLDVGCGGGLCCATTATTAAGTHGRTHDTIQSLEETLREHDAAVFAVSLQSCDCTEGGAISAGRSMAQPRARRCTARRPLEPLKQTPLATVLLRRPRSSVDAGRHLLGVIAHAASTVPRNRRS